MIGWSRARALVLALVLASSGLAACGCAGPGGGVAVPPAPIASPGDGGGAGGAANGNVATAAIAEAVYKLGSGDKVKVTVFNHPDLSGEFNLDGAGNFAVPLIGEIKAGGLTSRDLEQRIQDRFRDGYLVDPQVNVEVLNYRPFYILGEVKTPGSYPYQNNMTVLNAVALAGGFTYRAKQNGFLLQRGGSNSQGATVDGNLALLPGDIVTVQERFF
jgi:protein involved in polysaccharide export with SLBB domain